MATGFLLDLPVLAPPDLPERTLSGAAMRLFTSYFRPAVKNVGRVTGEKHVPCYLWNGSTEEVLVSDIQVENPDSGVSVTVGENDNIPAHEAAPFSAVILSEGDALEYDVLFIFTGSAGDFAQLEIVGTRPPVLSGDIAYLMFPHNWQDGFQETLEWKTDVMVAQDRTEQRAQLRTLPRRYFDLSLLVSGAGRRKLETWLGMRRTRYFAVPIWRDLARVPSAIAAGEAVVPIPENNDNYVDGALVGVWTSWDNLEVRVIDGHGADFVSVAYPFASSWPEGAFVAPVRLMMSFEERRISRFTEDAAAYSLRLRVHDDAWSPYPSRAVESFQSIPVCPFVPSWEGPEESATNKWVKLDNDTGVLEFDVQAEEPILSRTARFLLTNREDINDFLYFLKMQAGRLTPFWLAANDRGFELATAAQAEDNFLIIEPVGYEAALDGVESRKYLELVTLSGEVARLVVQSIETLPNGNEQLNLSSAVGLNVSAADLNRSAWFELVRLNSDNVTLNWVAVDCLEVSLSIVVLP